MFFGFHSSVIRNFNCLVITRGLCLVNKSLTILFRRFIKGPNFMPWFKRRQAVADQEQHRLWRQARMNTDIQQFLSNMSELEMVDSFNAIERHILGELQVMFLICLCLFTLYPSALSPTSIVRFLVSV